MKLNLLSVCTTRFLTYLVATLMLVGLAACGGGNGGPGAPLGEGEGGGSLKPVLDFLSTNTTIPPGVNSAIPIEVVVADKFGAPQNNAVVTFSFPSGSTIAKFSPTSGIAKTGSDGVASILVVHGASSGTDTLSATSTFNDSTGTQVTVSNTIGVTAQ